jgi:hypothetical protein
MLCWLSCGYVNTEPLCEGGWIVVSALEWLVCPDFAYDANSSASVLRAALLGASSTMRGAEGGGWSAKNNRG